MHSDKFSDKELGNDVKNLPNPAKERREEDEKMRQVAMEEIARLRQRILKLDQEEREIKERQEKEKRIDFFPTWKPAQIMRQRRRNST